MTITEGHNLRYNIKWCRLKVGNFDKLRIESKLQKVTVLSIFQFPTLKFNIPSHIDTRDQRLVSLVDEGSQAFNQDLRFLTIGVEDMKHVIFPFSLEDLSRTFPLPIHQFFIIKLTSIPQYIFLSNKNKYFMAGQVSKTWCTIHKWVN